MSHTEYNIIILFYNIIIILIFSLSLKGPQKTQKTVYDQMSLNFCFPHYH